MITSKGKMREFNTTKKKEKSLLKKIMKIFLMHLTYSNCLEKMNSEKKQIESISSQLPIRNNLECFGGTK